MITKGLATFWILTAALCAYLLTACSRDSGSGLENSSAEADLNSVLAAISADNIQSSLNYLATDAREGRMTGSRGYHEAASYVADQFATIGLDPGGTDQWFQAVPLISRMIDTQRSGVTLHTGAGDVALEWKEDVVIYADRLRPTNRIRAEVVFAGFGVHAPELGYSDFEGIDVKGKIVATFLGAPATFPSTARAHYSSDRTKTTELTARGAIGHIHLRSRLEEKKHSWAEEVHNLGTQPELSWVDRSGGVADFHSQLQGEALFSRRSAQRLFTGSDISFEEALDAAEQAQPLPTLLGVEATMYRTGRHERTSSPNVVGIIRGSDPTLADEYIVLSTHLDHLGIGAPVGGDAIYNGMYDNAFGVAMVLEVARALASLTAAPRRSIIFLAVTGEEQGLLGSDYFAHYPTVPSEAIVANVNMDMPLMLFPMNTVVGYGADHSSLQDLALIEADKEGFKMIPDPFPDEVYFIRSDQYSFVRQGIPAIYFAEGNRSSDPAIDSVAILSQFDKVHYHQPSDDLSQPIHWETSIRFTRAAVRIVYRIAMDDQRPAWNNGDFFGEKFGRQAQRLQDDLELEQSMR